MPRFCGSWYKELNCNNQLFNFFPNMLVLCSEIIVLNYLFILCAFFVSGVNWVGLGEGGAMPSAKNCDKVSNKRETRNSSHFPIK